MTYASGTTPVEAGVVEGGDGTTGVVVTLPEGVAEAIENTSEPISAENSEAVALAEIHSETAIELAQIEADASVARIEAHNEGDEEWRTETTHLREEVRALGEAVGATAAMVEALIAERSTPQPSPETDPQPEPEPILSPETMTDTPATETETLSETPTDHHAESEAERRALADKPARRRHRMI